jgi:hypothetical protein
MEKQFSTPEKDWNDLKMKLMLCVVETQTTEKQKSGTTG